MYRIHSLLLILLLSVLFLRTEKALAQEREGPTQTSPKAPTKGVVWSPPSDPSQANAALISMKAAGIEAIRTPIIQNESILSTADQLGLQIYQDLPIKSLSHTSLIEELKSIDGIMMTVFQRAKRHSSTRNFGILTLCDNSEPVIRTELQSILQTWKSSAPEGTRFYYIPAFLDDDCCASLFDFALIEAFDQEDPSNLLSRWRKNNQSPVGFSSFGLSWTDVTEEGHATSNSDQRAARFFEDRLPGYLEDPSLEAIFIEQWRDDADINILAGDRYSGLINPEGNESIAFEVVSGILTGRQTQFAINRGQEEPIGPPHWAIFFAWIIVGLTGLVYGYSNAFQGLIRRYFVGHGFYLQEIKQARNISTPFTLSITLLTTLIFGVLMSTLFSIASDLPRFDLAVGILPSGLQRFCLLVESIPWFGLLASMLFYISYLLLCATILVVSSRVGSRVNLYQAMMVVVGSRWMLVVPFLMSTLALTVSLSYKKWAIYSIFICMLALFLVSNGRAILDYKKLTNIPVILSAFVVLFVPALLLGLVVFWAYSQGFDESMTFLLNLTTKA